MMAEAERDGTTPGLGGTAPGLGGVVVQGAVQRYGQLESKLFKNGGFRESSKIVPLMPQGGAGLKKTVPRRKHFGAEGEEGDAAHATAMKQFSIKEFGETHAQVSSRAERSRDVGAGRRCP